MRFEVQQILMAGEFIVKPGTVLGPRELNEYEIVFFPNASTTVYHTQSDSYSLASPCVVLTGPGEPHTYQFDMIRPTRHLFTHFTLTPEDGLHQPYLPPMQPLTSPSIIPHVFRHLLLLIHEQPEDYVERTRQWLSTLLVEYIGMAKPKPNPKSKSLPPKVVQALRIIEANMGKAISISEIAKIVGWSPEHLSRSLSATLGVSPQHVIRQTRLRRACQLLCQSNLTIAEIAHAVGFEDENYFCRVFRREKNMTATEFRNLYSDPRYLYIFPEDDYLSPYPTNQYFR